MLSRVRCMLLLLSHVFSQTWAFIWRPGSSQSGWSCQVPLAGPLGTRLLAQLEGWMMQNPPFPVMQSRELAGASGQLFVETKSTLIKCSKRCAESCELLADLLFLSVVIHQSSTPVLCRPSWVGARMQAGNWDVSLEKLTPSRTFQNKQPPLSSASCQLGKAHGKQAQAGAWRGAGEKVTKQHLQPQVIHWNLQRNHQMVQKDLPDITTGQIL